MYLLRNEVRVGRSKRVIGDPRAGSMRCHGGHMGDLPVTDELAVFIAEDLPTDAVSCVYGCKDSCKKRLGIRRYGDDEGE
jgi:hypothetical protein